jgi:hypothetical protein
MMTQVSIVIQSAFTYTFRTDQLARVDPVGPHASGQTHFGLVFDASSGVQHPAQERGIR